MRNGKLQLAKLSAEEFRSLWEDLAGQDPAKGWRALWTFVAADAKVAAAGVPAELLAYDCSGV